MYVIRDMKQIYLAHPRTASQSIAAWLQDRYDVEVPHARRRGDHHGFDHQMIMRLQAGGYKVWCVVRDPFDWIVSLALKHEEIGVDPNPKELERWLVNMCPEGSNSLYSPPPRNWIEWQWGQNPFYRYSELSDFVLNFEELPQCLETVGLDCSDFPHINPSTGRVHAGFYYNDVSRQIVKKIFHI